jgi:SAM-dependent methyltransferase
LDLHQIAPGLTHHEAGYWVTPEGVRTSYPADGNDFCFGVEEQSFWFSHRNRAITAAVTHHPPVDGPIFDIGGGNGVVSAALHQAGFAAITIEPSPAGAANAVRRGVPQVVCGSLPSQAFHENTAGAIGLFDVIEHVEDDVAFLRALRPYLRRNGRLYATVPAYQWLWSVNDVSSGHYRRYTLTRLAEVLRRSGYDTEYGTYLFALLPPAIFLFRRLLGRKERSETRIRNQHRPGGTLGRRLTDAAFSFEINRIARGASVPFGASCLIVATPAH